ncbi:MAG TPA: hypothetical protein VI792_06750 [Candidatus Eisenbacteria bacterium]
MRHALLAAVLLAAITSPAVAAVPTTMSYQGVLMDGAGNLVSDGNYDLTFRLYTVSSGGAAIWTETQSGVAVSKGGFSVILGSNTPLTLAFDVTYWLSVQVGRDPELSPRVPLASSPYALNLRVPWATSLNGATPVFTIANSGPGAALVADGRLDVGKSNSGDLGLYRAGLSPRMAHAYTTSVGGNLDIFDANGNATGLYESDVDGLGGFFCVLRGPGLGGFTVDGNTGGTGDPTVTISGNSRACVFAMGSSGNASVQLPNDAISAAEILDEPGTASAGDDAALDLDGTFQSLLARTITVPAPGYVLVIGSLQANATHVSGAQSFASFGVSNAFGTLPAHQDFALSVPDVAPTATYSTPVSPHSLFTVGAGANTFYLIGHLGTGSMNVTDRQLTLVYLPTAYGTVVAPGPPAGPGLGAARAAGTQGRALSAADVRAEQDQAAAFAAARLERELRDMTDRAAEIRRQLDRSAAAQAHASAAAGR